MIRQTDQSQAEWFELCLIVYKLLKEYDDEKAIALLEASGFEPEMFEVT